VGSVISSGQRSLLLFLPAADADVEADDAVLIACTDDGKVAIEIVLALDDLLRTLRDVGGVGEGDIVGEFLSMVICGVLLTGLVSVMRP